MATNLEVLGLRVDLDTKDAKRGMDRLQGAISKKLKTLDKDSKEFNKGIGKFVHQFVDVKRTAVPMLKDVEKSYHRLQRSVMDVNSELERWQNKLSTASADERGEIQKEIKVWEKLRDAREKAMSGMERVKEDLETRIIFDKDEFVSAMKDAGRELYDPVERLLAKDLPGAFESGGKLVGKGIEKAFKGGSWLAKVGGRFGQEAGASMTSKGKMSMAKGGIMGKVGGAAQMAGGGALQGIGKMAAGLAPVLNIVAKIGPLLGTMSSILVGVVKLFIDAEAAAKDFNKDILASSGSAGYLYKNFNRIDAGASDLGDTLKQVRDQASSLDNIGWGINKDTHKAVISSLTAEGVSLQRLQDDYANTAKSAKDSAGYAKGFGTTVQMAVAFSRNLGVSLADIGSLQAEMMTDMGMGLKSVELSFSQMSKSAEDGGIASNKFFGIIRGVSADLSLYNTRMEETVKILGLLGKVMSPRNAQKFMQTATQALKGMSRTDRLKTNLLGGGNMGKLVDKDLDRKSKDVSGKIAEAGGQSGLSREDLMTKSMSDIMEGVSKEQQGTLREAISEMRMDNKANKKGAFGSSIAGRNLGPGAALQAIKSSLNITGKGKLRDRRGDLGTEMLADANGIGEDQLAAMSKFEEAIDNTRDELKADLKSGGDRQLKALKKLDKAGLKAEDIDSAGYDDILATLDKSEQDALRDGSKQIDFAKDTGKFQTSLLDKVGSLAEFIMNQVYNVLSGIWDALVDSAVFGDAAKRKERDLSKTVKDSKDSDMTKALGGAEGDANKFKGNLMEAAAPMLKQISEGIRKKDPKSQDAFSKMAGAASTDETLAAIKDALGDAGLYGGKDQYDAAQKDADAQGLQGSSRDDFLRSKQMQSGVVSASDGKVDFSKFSPDDLAAVFEKLGWHMDPMKLAKVFPSVKATVKTDDGKPSGPSEPPAPQAAPADAPAPVAPKGLKNPVAPPLAKDAPTADQQDQVISSLDDTHNALRRQGVVIDKPFLKTHMGKQMEDSTLEALRQALYEYYLYKDLKHEDVAKAIQGGMNPRELGSSLADQMGQGLTPDKAITQLAGHATGGVVSAIENGMAQVRPAAGEGLASIGRGERIVPAGGGGSGAKMVVELVMQGDLKRLIRAEASNVYYENEGAKHKK